MVSTGFHGDVEDLRRPRTALHGRARLSQATGDTSIVINNAGVSGANSLIDSDVADVERVFATNVAGALRVAETFAPCSPRTVAPSRTSTPSSAARSRSCTRHSPERRPPRDPAGHRIFTFT
ncbi:MAG: SDR family NAD(P)-dependent oxidoreductase [Janthinobacterium lividum]